MALTEELVSSLVHQLFGTYKIHLQRQGDRFLSMPWKRKLTNGMTGAGGARRLSSFRYPAAPRGLVRPSQKSSGFEDTKKRDNGKRSITKIFENLCEDKLIQPTFINPIYPVEVCSLSQSASREKPFHHRAVFVLRHFRDGDSKTGLTN